MTSPDVTTRSFVLFSASVLGWIVWLSFVLKYFFDAQMTGGWLVIGILVTLMAVGVILILNELSMAIAGLRLKDWKIFHARVRTPRTKKSRSKRKSVSRKTAPRKTTGRRMVAQSYRVALGLKPPTFSANRRRTRLFPTWFSLRWQRI